MKTTPLFCFFFMVLATGLTAQIQDAPFKKANQIIIETSDSPDIAYRKIAGILFDNGIVIANSDKDLLMMSTEPIETHHAFGAVRYKLSIRIEDGKKTKLKINGKFGTLNFNISQFVPISFEGMKNSPYMKGWRAMNKIAESYSGILKFNKI